jgi:Suppressor of fused protein (SUFU)
MTGDPEDDWEEVWDARADALARVLGAGHDQVFHATLPFAFGGQADVMAFHHHLDGVVYVTAELTGKPSACYAEYELMICHRAPRDWGPNVISRLAPYTQEAYIAAGETMDIDSATPADSLIKAFIFDTYEKFTLFGQDFDLRLCIGITKEELQFATTHGAATVLNQLKQRSIYPFTDLERASIPLEH